MSAGQILRILTYHRITRPEHAPHSDPYLISATPEMFTQHMKWLAKHYRVIDMPSAIEAVSCGAPLPRPAVLITFDDAYPDFLENAWPVLRRLQLPATLFVPTAYPDQKKSGFWWDRLYATTLTSAEPEITDLQLGRLPLHTRQDREHSLRIMQSHVKSLPHSEAMMWVDDVCRRLASQEIVTPATLGWDDLKLLSREGVTIGAHSRTHPLLTQITDQQLGDEISGAQQDIETMLGKALPIFCYPGGAYNEAICRIAKNAGIELGFATLLGHNHLNRCNPLCLKRINMTLRTTTMALRVRLSRVGIHADIGRRKVKKYLRSI